MKPLGIKTNDLFPVIEDLERIQRYMANTMGIGSLIDLEKFVDIRFAENACEKAGSVRLPSEMKNVSQIVTHIQSSRALEQESKTMLDKEGKYLIFAMGEQEYGIGILWIREIIGVMPIKTIPQTPDYIKGVINLRGNVIPVIDLRLRFSMEAKEYNERTCIIILDVASEERGKQVGMIVRFGFGSDGHQGGGHRGASHNGPPYQHELHSRNGENRKRRKNPFRYKPPVQRTGQGDSRTVPCSRDPFR